MLILLSLVPLLAAIAAIALLRKTSGLVRIAALIGSLTPLAFIPVLMGQVGAAQNVDWFSVSGVAFAVTASLLPINLLLFALVSIIAPLVVLYSFGFMDVLSDNRRFYVELLAFQAAMLAFSVAGSFLLLFIAWEFLSVTSYLLIGFWNQRESANHAARKTITIILIGDIALLAAIAIFFATYSTLDFAAIISAFAAGGMTPPALAALTLVMVAVFTKSAQFPFQEWLSAAMEGPTPVSAFLHSSTMVKAGVFLVMVLFPLFSPTRLMPAIAIVGAITALIGVFNALVGNHIKRILAYSTVEELGLMMFALGIGAYSAALFFFFAQTFYKALLFFYAGSLMRANKTEDIREMRDAGRNKVLLFSGIFGVLSLAGFVPFNGFLANVGVEGAATSAYAYGFLLFIDLMVSAMIARWLLLPIRGTVNKGIRGRLSLSYDTLPKAMTIPLVVLAALCLASSYLIGYVQGLSGAMQGLGYSFAPAISIGIVDAAAESAAVLAGIAIVYLLVYRRAPKESKRFDVIKRIMGNSLLFDGFYHYVATFGYHVAGAFEFIDSELNAAFDSVGRGAVGMGNRIRLIQTGSVNAYALATMAGLAIIIVFVVIG
ncbi:MAG: NADH-quinone oxidoreductase subunit L [Candidatus Micrarchaeota archaeon]|nr:NADH-quinone oxidoreductase subunit L [Candidatus Micrarchaeota archaeon]